MNFCFKWLICTLAVLLCSCSRAGNTVDTTDAVDSAATSASAILEQAQAALVFAGDAMQHQDQLDTAKKLGGGTFDYSDCFTLIAPTIQAADYAIVNLEVPLGGGKGGYTGFPCFSAPDSFAEALKDAGFDLFLTANNHTLDRGDAGLRRTIHVLDSLNVDHTGTFKDTVERRKLVPFIREVNGIKIAFLNYTYGTNGLTAKDGAEVAMLDKSQIAEEIKKAREAGAELISVMPHWGDEYVLTENAAQRDMAQFLIDEGADLIIGSHPHVIQPMKVIHSDKHDKDVLVVYSLGNFISNMKTNDTRGGALVTVTVERPEGEQARFKSATYDTFYSAKPAGDALPNFAVIPSWESAKIPSSQMGWWNTFNTSARRIFNKHNVNVPTAH
ncbi:MAG: CapA family protein [Prevotella sp.]|nr:CapA family protein [Prevotella sp.]MCM1074764.1 CapA family protein [Ruminococcus sp.]